MKTSVTWQRIAFRTFAGASAALAVALVLPAMASPGERTRASASQSEGRTRVEPRAERTTASAVSSSDRSSGSSSQPSAESGSARSRTRVQGESRYGRHGSRGHGGHSYGSYPRYGYLGYYDRYFYWPWWWGGWYYASYPYGYERGYRHGYDGYDDAGALDFDVSPERAEIYVDGQYIGVADDFDGFPSYLWLPKGTYDVAVYLPGFRTIARQYSVYPGVVIDVEDEMTEGEAVKPEELVSKSTVNKEERLRRDQERAEAAERREGRQRRELPRAEARDEAEPGRLSLKISPDDASVYLDGRFLGTAGELSRLHAGLIVDAGNHRLEVVRPGYDGDTVEFALEPGEETKVSIDLSHGDDEDDEE